MKESKIIRQKMYMAFIWILFVSATLCGITAAYENTSEISQGREFETVIFFAER